MPHYKHGKITFAISEDQFVKGMNEARFCKKKHKALLAALHYLGLRRSEIIKLTKEQFHQTKETLYVDVGKRLKGSKETIMIPLPLDAPFVEDIAHVVHYTRKGQRVFPYSHGTVYNVVHRVFYYPHLHRLSRITWLIKNYGILAARSWTGLSLQTLEYYAGIVKLEEAGKGLSKNESSPL
ncbi:MAG: site-specific integrase [Candidatus Bathyarchaeota archaeon]|nr:site-specific integrase [Candidatus Bathyarchaeota archaeon]